MSESRGKEVVLRPLVEIDIRPIQSWDEFLRRWKRAQRRQSFDEMLSLMHISGRVELYGSGYHEKNYNEMDRLLFYLFYADGWVDKDLLEKLATGLGVDRKYRFGFDSAKGTAVNKNTTELRQMVAVKAADKLLVTLFETTRSDNKEIVVLTSKKLLVEPQIFSAVLNFFRIEKARYGGDLIIRNYPNKWNSPQHKQGKVRDFLISFSNFIWGWKEIQSSAWATDDEVATVQKQNDVIQAKLDAAKPWTIEVLSILGETQMLRKWLTFFDDACLAKLRDIAMRNSLDPQYHGVNEKRPVANIDEACLAGSVSAWLLKEHELVTREQNRLTAIRAAEDAKADADRKLQALTAK